MLTWNETSLGDACELYQPKTLTTADLLDDGEYLVYGANGVIGRYDKYNHEDAEILITCRGATCGTVNVSEPKSWVNGNAMVVKPRNGELDFNFLQHLLRGGIDLSVAITGAAQPQITRQSLAPIRFKYPPLPEQRRIAAILDKADALRAKRRKAFAQLDSLAQSIFVEMFGDPEQHIRAGNCKELAEVVAPGRIVTYGIVQAGPEVANGIPYIKTGDIKGGEILEHQLSRTSHEIAESYSRSAISSGDIVMSIRATVGTTALVPSSLKGANLTQGTARISPGTSVLSIYLLNYLRNSSVQKWIQTQVKGATFREITLGKLRQLPVYVPPHSAQARYVSQIQSVNKLRGIQALALSEHDKIFESLQTRAFTGQL